MALVNCSRDYGRKFEDNLHGYLTNFLKKYACIGVCYKMHDHGAGYQPIDLLIDSKELGYIGIECKSTYEINNLEMGKLNRCGEFNIGQIERQHTFLKNAGRYGILALESRYHGETWFIPHKYIFNKIKYDDMFLTINEVKDVGLKRTKNLDLDAFKNFLYERCNT